jgi:hypothetical protein
VAYCTADEVSLAIALQKTGIAASYLEGGIAHWKDACLPTRRKRDVSENKWVSIQKDRPDRPPLAAEPPERNLLPSSLNHCQYPSSSPSMRPLALILPSLWRSILSWLP